MAMRTLTDEEILAQIPAARRRAARSHAPAIAARFDRAHRRLHVTLANGSALLVPVDLIPTLRQASDAVLAQVEVTPAGLGVEWPAINQDILVTGLVRLALGRRMLLQASGAAGGASRSAAKVKASRRNGRKGGRPRKALRKSEA
jgi:hypothetical protein